MFYTVMDSLKRYNFKQKCAKCLYILITRKL